MVMNFVLFEKASFYLFYKLLGLSAPTELSYDKQRSFEPTLEVPVL